LVQGYGGAKARCSISLYSYRALALLLDIQNAHRDSSRMLPANVILFQAAI
jgi:hypothetical protein